MKMKKFLLAILSVLLIACLGAAFACSSESPDGTYYTLVFKKTNGVTYECDIPSGYEVLEGTTVTFRLKIADGAEGEPVVYANSEVLQPDSNKNYSFVISEDTVIRVDGLMAQGSEYNKLIFASTPGIAYKILTDGLKSGMMVKMGTQVSFSITQSENYSGNAVVYANGTPLVPSGNVYSFEMNSPTTISVDGITKNVDVTYVSGDTRVRYLDEQDNYITVDQTETTVAGDVLKFKVKISVYHVQTGYEVLANSIVLRPDADGYYTFELTDDTRITVSNLIEETSFVERTDGGSGTERDPYRISRPIDIYQMAMLINGGWHTDGRFFAGYYRLENDIDFDGEKVYVIGDALDTAGYAIFCGTFDGNGHTLSNYVMDDNWIEQEGFTQTYLTNVGLFGRATSIEGASPSIFNLHIDNAKINIDASRYMAESHVGVLIGESYGATVSGCTVTNSTIEIVGGEAYGAYVGGLIGEQLSAYSTTGNIRYFSSVSSCSTDVDIYVDNNFVYAVGGITGLLAVGEEHLTSYILNSYSTGNIEGGLNAGGIAGYAAPGTSVINCYSVGDVIANSPFASDSGYPEELFYAYAGGILGRAGFNTTVYNCFSTGVQDAVSAAQLTVSSAEFEVADPVAAKVEDGEDLQDAHAYPSTIFGSRGVEISEVTENFIRNTMHWDAEDWTFADGKPTFNSESTSKRFTITFSAESGFGSIPNEYSIDSQYSSLSRWYMTGDISEYVDGNNGNRSYGYFFDSELENRIPMSFVPTGDMTIYIGYANYNDVAGTYYLGESVETGAKLVLEADGTVTYINGALSQNAVYTWDGETVVILGSYLGELSEVFDDMEARYKEYYLSSLYNFGMKSENGAITITGGYVQEIIIETVPGFDMYGGEIEVEEISLTGDTFDLFGKDSPLTGLKSIDNFKYVDYYDGSTVYTFNGNGTGVCKGDTSKYFTYKYSDNNTLALRYDGESADVTATLDSDGYVTKIGEADVKAYDGFTGVWERPFAENATYTFDGKSAAGEGTWTKSGVGGTASGTYTVRDGVLTDSANSFTAKINDKGLLEITKGEVVSVYYVGGSLVGEWYYSQRPQGSSSSAVTINLTLNGIDNSGLGTAVAEYAVTGEIENLTYQAVETDGKYTLYIYNQSVNFAELTYNAQTNILEGTLNGAPARLTSYDGIKGLWISGDETVKEVQFNGRGYYDLPGDARLGAFAVNGIVYVNGASAGKYSMKYSDMTGEFTYKTVKYTFKYDLETNKIEVTADGKSFVLQSRDVWYARKLVDENGYVYSFDGRGELTSGGTATVLNGSGEGRKYTYHIEDDGSIKLTALETLYKNGTITRGQDGGKQVFLFTEEDKAPVTLTYSTPFTGEWIIGGEMGEITIDKVYADGTADGSYKFYGDEAETFVTFNYNEQGNYLSFLYGEDMYYVNALTALDVTELSIGPENSINGSVNSVCIPKSKADDYYGKTYRVYNADEKEDSGETMVFDGLSESVFGTGTVVLYSAEGKVSSAYSYSIDKLGNVLIVYGNSRFIMISWTKDSEIDYNVLHYVHDDDKYYSIVYPDSLYGHTIKDEKQSNVTYEFNGAGGVIRHNADSTTDVFTYFVLLVDNISFKHILRFTDEEGNVYSVTLDQSSRTDADWTVKMTEADEYFEVNAKDANSDEATFLFIGDGQVMRLTSSTEETSVKYSYEVVSKEGKVTTFTFTTAEGAQFNAVLDMSSDNEEEWTVTLSAKD